jgi:hypothetical protein
VSRQLREAIADWLMLAGAVVLLASLFFTWSHQLRPGAPGSAVLAGVPHNPTGWQVYSAADVCLAALAVALVLVSFAGGRAARLSAVVPAGVAVAFVVHAMSRAPTNGVNLTAPPHATSAAGEIIALAGLATALAGLLVSFTTD